MLEFSPEKSPATSPRKTIQEIHNEGYFSKQIF